MHVGAGMQAVPSLKAALQAGSPAALKRGTAAPLEAALRAGRSVFKAADGYQSMSVMLLATVCSSNVIAVLHHEPPTGVRSAAAWAADHFPQGSSCSRCKRS